ncbi:MAG: 3-deoxy-manno-octulosonate cytidylyltransferase [Gammaproteobacteria bacterium]|nr:3-deoxy-manno-octulosonate cytidylyltransferase [Gammaproteobacteria bacterium]
MSFSVIIPARYQSRRLPGKPLLEISGKPMIQHVYERACRSDADSVIVATDDQRVADIVLGFGGACCMTSTAHPSGTDRLQEVAKSLQLPKDHIVVNVQGDEPLIPFNVINQVAANLAQGKAGITTLCAVIDNPDDLFDPNIVKVVMDESGKALYFSRAPIPWSRDTFTDSEKTIPSSCDYYRHLGLYAYRVNVLDEYVKWVPGPLEVTERLEQLRALCHGVDIHVQVACESIPPGVDTEGDLQRVRQFLKQNIPI